MAARVGEGDGCVLPGGMSSSRSPRPWPRLRTTPQEDRRRPGPGRGFEVKYTAPIWERPLPRRQAPSTLPWTWTRCLPPVAPDQTCLCSTGAGPAALRGAACRTCVWGTGSRCSCAARWTCRLSTCPRSLWTPLLCEGRVLSRRWWSSSWKCRARVSARACGTDFAGVEWRQYAGAGEIFWCMGRTTCTRRRERPFGFTASPGRCTNTGQGRGGAGLWLSTSL